MTHKEEYLIFVIFCFFFFFLLRNKKLNQKVLCENNNYNYTKIQNGEKNVNKQQKTNWIRKTEVDVSENLRCSYDKYICTYTKFK